MNMRPRCRDWLPLATQQLRLRNLTRIEGLYIECTESDDALIYYTLHSGHDGQVLYTSETLPQRHLHQKWAEIDAGEEMRKSNANCICVKVWAHWDLKGSKAKSLTITDANLNVSEQMEPKSALTKRLVTNCLTPNKLTRPPELLLFTWAVYFSGLMPLTEQEDEDTKWRSNSLIFHLNGKRFTSPEQFSVDGLRDQLSLNYQRYSSSVPKPVSHSGHDDFSINSPSVSRSSSPVVLNKNGDLLRMSTTRYTLLICRASEVRKSYNLRQLLRIQELQRLHLQKLREIDEVSENIKRLCVRCITRNELRCKPRTTSFSTSGNTHVPNHSMGRTLSVLLAEQQQIEPLMLYNTQQLQAKLEALRSKHSLLATEKTTYAKRIDELFRHFDKLKSARSQIQNWLEQYFANLKCEQHRQKELSKELVSQKEYMRQVQKQMKYRMSTLCVELQEIYSISRHQSYAGVYSICGINIPNIESYVSGGRYVNNMNLENASPLALSAALGYIAHLVQMISIIINKPLRNPIVYETSRSRITDIIKELPYTSREFPLYTRSALPSKPVKYAIYLLNQNIAQLCYDITGRRCDLRATFENLIYIFNVLSEIERNQCDDQNELLRLNLLVATDEIDGEFEQTKNIHKQTQQRTVSVVLNNGSDCEHLTKSHSSVDMNHVPVPPPRAVDHLSTFLQLLPATAGQALAIEGYATTAQRTCRSVGSYSDCEDDFKEIIEHTYSNSDSNITFQTDTS